MFSRTASGHSMTHAEYWSSSALDTHHVRESEHIPFNLERKDQREPIYNSVRGSEDIAIFDPKLKMNYFYI